MENPKESIMVPHKAINTFLIWFPSKPILGFNFEEVVSQWHVNTVKPTLNHVRTAIRDSAAATLSSMVNYMRGTQTTISRSSSNSDSNFCDF